MSGQVLWAHAGVLAALLLAFACLAVAMPRHQADLFGCEWPRSRSWAWRALGWLGVLASGWGAIHFLGWGFGMAAWCGHASLAAGVVLVALALQVRWQTSAAKA
ncbi:DUF3325 domain-containing protein [Lampropedia puyangensis]|uniref:DUF3325 domain-containing protein n=1 Tax=Lampropedia puyangensis TaxID=1330072 RepID=A0A4S8F6Q4_9BURK|nr:DUF3325 domain-containing protein [Lampropedia puyangensis]THU01934.1 DUF3325 domain-containing protein [Lampropedia puyangensis]